MNSTRRAFLRAAVVAPVLAGAWVIWEGRGARLKVRTQPACCLADGVPGKSCKHPAAERPVAGRAEG